MHRIVSDEALDILFRAARDSRSWLARPQPAAPLPDASEACRFL